MRLVKPWVRFPVGLRCVFSSDPAVSSSIFVGGERDENLIRNDPEKSEFTIEWMYSPASYRWSLRACRLGQCGSPRSEKGKRKRQLGCVFSSDTAVSSSIFVGAEREENLIRNDPDKSEFTIERM